MITVSTDIYYQFTRQGFIQDFFLEGGIAYMTFDLQVKVIQAPAKVLLQHIITKL